MKKRSVLIFLLSLISIISVNVGVTAVAYAQDPIAPVEYAMGDANLDGKVNSRDAVLIKQFVIGLTELSEKQKLFADVNGDGKVNSRDAVKIQQFIIGMIDDLGEHQHVFDKMVESDIYLASEATCTSGKTYYYSCSCECFGSQTFEVGEPIGHTYNKEVTAPTCTEQGYSTYTCACGDSYVSDYVDALGHNFNKSICSKCGFSNLAFTLSEDENSYIVTGMGECIETEIIIPETYNGKPVTAIAESAFASNKTLSKVEIASSVKVINASAFAGCENLVEIIIPYGVERIEGGAISSCISLKHVEIPESVTHIGDTAFYWDLALETIVISNSVATIGHHAFAKCPELQYVIMGNGVKTINYLAFAQCDVLIAFYYVGTPEEWNAINKTYSNDVLTTTPVYYYTENTDAIPNDGVKRWSYDENGNPVVVTHQHKFTVVITAPTCTEQGYTTYTCWCEETYVDNYEDALGHNFSKSICANCGLSNLGFALSEDENSYIVTGMGDCTETEIIIPETYNGKPVTAIAESAFIDNKTLTKVKIADSVKVIGASAFAGCGNITEINIPYGVERIENSTFQVCAGLTNIEIPETVTYIGNTAFYWCENLEKIVIPNSVITLGAHVFASCKKAQYVVMGNGVKTINYLAFNGCSVLEAIYYVGTPEEWNAINKTWSNEALTSTPLYYYHENAEDVPNDGVKRWSYDENRNPIVVEHKHKYTSIDTKVTCTEQGYTTHTCKCGYSYKDNIVEPLGHRYQNDICLVCGLGKLAFELSEDGNSYVVTGIVHNLDNKIIIPKTFKGKPVTAIAKEAFYNYENIISVEIPDSVTTIGQSAFAMCSSLQSIAIPNSITTISDFAFACCNQLESIVIPNSITSIGHYAFYECFALDRVYYSGTASEWAQITIASENAQLGEATVYYYVASAQDVPNDNGRYWGYNQDGTIKIWANATFNNLSFVLSEDGNSYVVNGMGDCTETQVIIPETYNGKPVTAIGWYAFFGCTKLSSIVIPDSVRDIGRFAFYGCISLERITIPSSVKSIGWYAFYECSALEKVTIEDGVEFIGEWAFFGCSSLESITIPNSVKEIEDCAFYSCTSIKYNEKDGLKYLGNDTNKYLYLIGACKTDILTVNIDKNCKFIGPDAFRDCTSLLMVEIPYGVKNIGSFAFKNCTALKSVIISDSVINIGNNAFSGCRSLSSVELGGNVKSIGWYAFYNCKSLKSIVIPESVEEIVAGAFAGCSILEMVLISGGVEEIGYSTFYNCASLQYNVKGGLKYLGNETNKYLYLVGVSDKNITTAEIDSNCKFIGLEAFKDCTKLTSVTIPEGVTTIGVGAFYNCIALENVVIPSSVKSIEYIAFYNCTALTNIVIPNGVATIGAGAFAQCSQLESVEIPESVKTIGAGAFYNCIALESVEIPSTVKVINAGTFYGCISLDSVEIPDGVTTIGSYAFADCVLLENVEVPESVINVGNNAFGNVEYVKQTEKDGLIYLGSEKNEYLLLVGVSDTSITIAEVDSNCKYIKSQAFNDCTALENVVIPSSVVAIAENAFGACTKIEKVYYKGNAEGWAKIDIANNNAPLINAKRYYLSK